MARAAEGAGATLGPVAGGCRLKGLSVLAMEMRRDSWTPKVLEEGTFLGRSSRVTVLRQKSQVGSKRGGMLPPPSATE